MSDLTQKKGKNILGIALLYTWAVGSTCTAAYSIKNFLDKDKPSSSDEYLIQTKTNFSGLKDEDVSFNYVLGAQHYNDTTRIAWERDQAAKLETTLKDFTSNIDFQGDGVASLNFFTVSEKVRKNAPHAKHNIVWVNMHGVNVKDYNDNVHDSVVVDTYLLNEYASEHPAHEELSFLLALLRNSPADKQNTFVLQPCNTEGAIFTTNTTKRGDMCIFSSAHDKVTYNDVENFTKTLSQTDTDAALDRQTLVQTLLQATAKNAPEQRNLFTFTLTTDENIPDPEKIGFNTRVVSLEDQGRKFQNYKPEDIFASLHKQGIEVDEEQILHLQDISKNMKDRKDFETLDERDFYNLMMATYCISMDNIKSMPNVWEYVKQHHFMYLPTSTHKKNKHTL